jgi:hypothetical protein
MYLAEAIKERDYLKKSIDFLTKFVGNVLVSSDRSSYRSVKSLIDSKREELNELYTRYQQLDVAIARVKAKTIIKVNDTELSIMDACTIRDIMKDKEQKLGSVFNMIIQNDFEVLELSGLLDDIEDLGLDIKSIESKIEYAQWYTEVS